MKETETMHEDIPANSRSSKLSTSLTREISVSNHSPVRRREQRLLNLCATSPSIKSFDDCINCATRVWNCRAKKKKTNKPIEARWTCSYRWNTHVFRRLEGQPFAAAQDQRDEKDANARAQNQQHGTRNGRIPETHLRIDRCHPHKCS